MTRHIHFSHINISPRIISDYEINSFRVSNLINIYNRHFVYIFSIFVQLSLGSKARGKEGGTDVGIPTRLKRGVAIRSETTRVTERYISRRRCLSKMIFRDIVYLERAVRPISQQAAAGAGSLGEGGKGDQPAGNGETCCTRRCGDEMQVVRVMVVMVVMVSSRRHRWLRQTTRYSRRVQPRASTCQMAAHISEVCPANMTDCNLRESKPHERRPPGKT